MAFHPIDLDTWPRREYYLHYMEAVPCTYSLTVELDITRLRTAPIKLYPAMLHAITTCVNRHPEFRTALGSDGLPGVFDQMLPCYTVFHPDTETFSNLWTVYDPDISVFLANYQQDLALYGQTEGFDGKPDVPGNTFPVSMLPWVSFQSFQLHLPLGHRHLLPIFTMGRFFHREDACLLPLSVQVHHAVCDGFHVSRFLSDLQEILRQMPLPGSN